MNQLQGSIGVTWDGEEISAKKAVKIAKTKRKETAAL